jgi:hypothetical protein
MSEILDYVPQPDVYTCQSACCAKVCGITDVYSVRDSLEGFGEPGSPEVMGLFLTPRVKEYEFVSDASLQNLKDWLAQGYTLITHGWFSDSGHVICLVGRNDDDNGFLVDDPYGEFDVANWTWTDNIDGNNLIYSDKLIYATCIAGQSVWEAKDVYGRRVIPNLKGAWVHKIKN